MNEEHRARFKGWSKRILKLLGWGVVFVFILALIGNSIPTLRGYLIRGIDKYARWAAAREAERKEEVYRRDTHGGTTPEETLDLFIEALRQNDVELASKYYTLEVQEKAKQKLQDRKLEGTLDKRTTFFTLLRKDGEKKCNSQQGGCVITRVYIAEEEKVFPIEDTSDKLIIPKGGSLEESVSFSKNNYSNIWKITQPY